jgi:hypothetical protein
MASHPVFGVHLASSNRFRQSPVVELVLIGTPDVPESDVPLEVSR